MSSRAIFSRTVLVLLFLTFLAGCTSRYRMELFEVRGEGQRKIKVEKTQYITGAVLADPMAAEKVVKGNGSCIVLNTGARGDMAETDKATLVGYDKYLRYMIYMQLPQNVRVETYPLDDRSFAHLLGEYELPAGEKMFLCTGGSLVVDSIPKKHLYGEIKADYENAKGEPVTFQGRFRVKVAR